MTNINLSRKSLIFGYSFFGANLFENDSPSYTETCNKIDVQLKIGVDEF